MIVHLQQEYFDWLCQIIGLHEQSLYWLDVLWALRRYEFVARLSKDENRIADALELRREFGGYFRDPVSVLEVLIALARRGEWEIMHDPDFGDRTSVWFWMMIHNLGLDKFAYFGALDDPKNDMEFMKIVENFVERGYGRDGNGGPFFGPGQKVDMRRTELWDQMCYYFDQYF